MTALPPHVYRYRQGDFDAIAGGPWVYWITTDQKRVFDTLPRLSTIAVTRAGMHGGDRFRFARLWWEVGFQNIAFFCESVSAVRATGRVWVPLMKGGQFRRWWGNQEWVISFDDKHYRILEISGNRLPSREYYFRSGLTCSKVTASRISARWMPPGFIFADATTTFFPMDLDGRQLLAILNSSIVSGLMLLISPTVNFEAGQLANLPVPTNPAPLLLDLVDQAIALAKDESSEDEGTYNFIAPPAWAIGLADGAARQRRLAAVEQAIDEEVYRLYGIDAADRAAIESELRQPSGAAEAQEATDNNDDDRNGDGNGDDPEPGGDLTRPALAERWLSYAVGVMLGRFQAGVDGALGRGEFAPDVAAALRALADPDGLMVIEAGHPDDLTARVERALELMVSADQIEALIAAATGGRPLEDYLARDFFKAHVQRYRKRPIYWLLQSPKRLYSVYVFHERLTPDSLYLLQGNRYLGGARNGVATRLAELRRAAVSAPAGAARRAREREIEAAQALANDLDAFDRHLQAVTAATDERGQVVGWRPAIDDGVLINLAPLHTLLPAWAAEPRACWAALARGDYDWSHTAMRYWPDRVRAACQKNRSYAIAHGLDAEAGG